MRIRLVLAAAATLVLMADGASAAGCRRHRLGSENYSLGINSAAPSRAILNPCSSMYDFGRHSRRRFRRLHPHAIVRH